MDAQRQRSNVSPARANRSEGSPGRPPPHRLVRLGLENGKSVVAIYINQADTGAIDNYEVVRVESIPGELGAGGSRS
jgi:hypothetical protein